MKCVWQRGGTHEPSQEGSPPHGMGSYLPEVLQADLHFRFLADAKKLLFEHGVLLLDTVLESVDDFFLGHVLGLRGFVPPGLGSEITSRQ